MLITQEITEQLLNPISEDAPCGIYLKGDRALYRPLRNEFNVAMTSLRKLTQNPDVNELESLQEENKNNWQAIAASLNTTLSTQSRDIELIGWMLAAQLILDNSLSSFVLTSQWFCQLAEANWQDLQPLLPSNKLKSESEEDQAHERCEAQLKAFTQLLGESEDSSLLYAPLLMLPLIGDITFYQYQSAEKRGELSVLRAEASSLVTASKDDVSTLLNNLQATETNFQKLAEITKLKAAEHGLSYPSFSSILALINKVKNAVTQLTGVQVSMASTAPTEATEQSDDSDGANNSQGQATAATVTSAAAMNETTALHQLADNVNHSFADIAHNNEFNRNKAFHLLREISEFFRVSEPQSPVAPLIEKAIRWGNMPLSELLAEMLAEQKGGTEQIFSSAGLNQAEKTVLPDMVKPTVSTKNEAVTSNSATKISTNTTDSSLAGNSTDSETKQSSDANKSSSTSSGGLRW